LKLIDSEFDNIFLNGKNIFDSDVKYQSEPMAFSRPAEKKLSKHRQSVNKAIDFFSSFKIFYAKK
tara:strand:- start:493 stop:687 length:195 start_codon:yes stop_codon:yes gene_type:complete